MPAIIQLVVPAIAATAGAFISKQIYARAIISDGSLHEEIGMVKEAG
jgi:hypothetical protein